MDWKYLTIIVANMVVATVSLGTLFHIKFLLKLYIYRSRYDVKCDTNSLHYPTDLVVALRDGENH